MTMPDGERQVDGEAAVKFLQKQREANADARAQAEGHIAYLGKVITAQRDMILKKNEQIIALQKQLDETKGGQAQ